MKNISISVNDFRKFIRYVAKDGDKLILQVPDDKVAAVIECFGGEEKEVNIGDYLGILML